MLKEKLQKDAGYGFLALLRCEICDEQTIQTPGKALAICLYGWVQL